MRLQLTTWRRSAPEKRGGCVTYEMDKAVSAMSFLELLDVLNERLERAGEEPVAIVHDCRERICGSSGSLINGRIRGPLHAFPVIKDLVVNRSVCDRVMQAGGFISVN